jgi:hypothetical protein
MADQPNPGFHNHKKFSKPDMYSCDSLVYFLLAKQPHSAATIIPGREPARLSGFSHLSAPHICDMPLGQSFKD